MEISGGMKKRTCILLMTATYLFTPSAVVFADARLSLSGRVSDSAGNPIKHATVMVYHAGVRNGYSTYCPSCYADCGKRTITDRHGIFTFKGLSPDLWFQLLVASEGYEPAFINRVIEKIQCQVLCKCSGRRATTDDRMLDQCDT